MCSIAGIYNSSKNSNIDKIVLEKMSSLLKHRGPDSSEQQIFPKIGFAHNRLSIIDLKSRANQPYRKYNKTLIFNGFICNYLDLREELTQDFGYQFNSESDTEVILAAFDCWGVECFNRLNGMWAIAIYDHGEDALMLCRDRYGIKPLYFTWIEDSLYFASEYKAFKAIPKFDYVLDKANFLEFINTGLLEHNNQTLFSNIWQVRAGHYIKTSSSIRNEIKQTKYYFLVSCEEDINYESQKDIFDQLLQQAVNQRLIADRAISLSLSGGLDSNAILSKISENSRKKIISFSSFDKTDPKSEYKEINDSKTFFGINNIQTTPKGAAFFKELSTMTYSQEIPIFSTSIFAQRNIYQSISREGYKVSLSGQGADESLMGYDFFIKKQILNQPLRFLFSPSKWFFLFKKRATKYFINYYLSKEFQKQKQKRTDIKSAKELSLYMFTKSVLPLLLHIDDRNSMSFGVESRLPFLDFKLVDFIFKLPESSLLGNFDRKKILKDVLKNKIPDSIFNKKRKSAFYTPSESWFREMPLELEKELKKLAIKHQSFLRKGIDTDKLAPTIKIKIYAILLWLDLFKVKY